jgi:adenylylsulfate kinase
MNKNGFTIWLTGPSGAGKTYLAEGLKEYFDNYKIPIEILDGDQIRKLLYPDIGFTESARKLHNRVIINTAKLLTKHGIANIVSLISPYQSIRAIARKEIERFIEVYVDSTKEARIKRDPKGLYAKAIRGEITNLTGYDGIYEKPKKPEVTVNSCQQSLSEEVFEVTSKCIKLGFGLPCCFTD